MSEKLTWSAIIPLIGGFPLGAHEAIGHPAEEIIGFDGFWNNDGEFMAYYGKKYGTPYRIMEHLDQPLKKVNIAVATPPCAGLCMLTSSSASANKRGPNADQNIWIHRACEVAFHHLDTDVLIIENAPALYTNYGKPLLERLKQYAWENGRSITALKTSTLLHGIPQARQRCFVFMWKSEFAPILEYYDRPRKNATEYLKEVNSSMTHWDDMFDITRSPTNMFLMDYLPKKLGPDWYQIMVSEKCKSGLGYILTHNLWDDAIATTDSPKVKKVLTHCKDKIARKMGYWDSSILPIGDKINGLIGKSMGCYIHPTEMRLLNIRECLHFMGHPHDFTISTPKKVWIIPQNVPTAPSRDVVLEAMKFVRGELPFSEGQFVKQNNIKQEVQWVEKKETING